VCVAHLHRETDAEQPVLALEKLVAVGQAVGVELVGRVERGPGRKDLGVEDERRVERSGRVERERCGQH
jgi:hypothetical protein